MRKAFWFLIALPLLCLAGSAAAQTDPAWTEPFPPHRVIGNVYYVGSKGLASYLITTPQGHILINSSLETSVPLIKDSVEKLGFHFNDIKILLISHAHGDHCAGSARVKEMTGAKYFVMDADVPVIESGGRADFQYGASSNAHFKPTKSGPRAARWRRSAPGRYRAGRTSHARPHPRHHYLDHESQRWRQVIRRGNCGQSKCESRIQAGGQHTVSANCSGL